MEDKKYHSFRIEKGEVYLDDFALKKVHKKELYYEKFDGYCWPILKLEIILDPFSKVTIDAKR